MLKYVVGAAALLFANAASAATCVSYPNQLTNGTVADASQVMGNFNSILGCANTNLAPTNNPRFTGSVGVGVTTPQGPLDVSGNVFFGPATERFSIGSGQFAFNRSVSSGQIFDNTAYAYEFSHTGSTTAASDLLYMHLYDPTGVAVTIHPLTINGAANVAVGGNPNTSYQFYVNGAAGGTTAWTMVSDERLKKNVIEISDALQIVKQLRGVRFQWRPVDEREVGKSLTLVLDQEQVGFVAQEIQRVVPEAVTQPNPGSDGIYGVKADTLVPILLEAVKEQQMEIEKLEARLGAFERASSH